jgi:hypothetical protein
MITPNQAIALYHLRLNPNKIKQTTGTLTDCKNGRCALGLIAEAFNIPLNGFIEISNAYDCLRVKLDPNFSENAVSRQTDITEVIWTLNDKARLTYAEVADVMERVWEGEISYEAALNMGQAK